MEQDDLDTLYLDAFTAVRTGHDETAESLLETILSHAPNYADAYLLLSRIHGDRGNATTQIQLLSQALTLAPKDGEYRAEMGRCCLKILDFDNARAHLEIAEGDPHNSATTLDIIGAVYTQLGEFDKAATLFREAFKKDPDNPQILFNLATTLKACGDFDGAEDAFERTLTIAPDHHKAHAGLASLRRSTSGQNNIERLKSALDRATGREAKAHLGHALSKEYERVGNYDASFQNLRNAKKALLEGTTASISEDRQTFDALHDVFGGEPQALGPGYRSSAPLFVVGMPRSGTTLVDRILSNSPDVTSVGELMHFPMLLRHMSGSRSLRVLDAQTARLAIQGRRFEALGQAYVESVQPLYSGTPRFLDKFHLNILLVGFIVAALPDCRIVCLDRNPLDTIIGNYRQLFEVNSTSFNYALNLEATTTFTIQFRRLMQLWARLYPKNFTIVRYESLVANPAHEARILFDACGLSWRDGYERAENNPAAVATASSVQVRSPVHTRFVNRWKRYEAHLSPAKLLLDKAGIDWGNER